MKKRYFKQNNMILDKKKNIEISIEEGIRRMNLMNNRITSQQERLKDLQEALYDETGIRFWI